MQVGEPAGRFLDHPELLGILAAWKQDQLGRDPGRAQCVGDGGSRGLPGARLGHEEGAACLETLERLYDAGPGRAVAQLVPAERRGGAQEQRPQDRVGKVAFQGLHDPGQADDPVHPQRRRIEGRPGCRQGAHRRNRVGTAQQGPRHGRAPDALGEDLRRAVEPGSHPTAIEVPPVARVNGGAAPRGDDAGQAGPRVRGSERLDRAALPRAEARLALLGEDRRDRAPGFALDLLVHVDERCPTAAREAATDRGLAAPGQPDEDQVHGSSSRPHPTRRRPIPGRAAWRGAHPARQWHRRARAADG